MSWMQSTLGDGRAADGAHGNSCNDCELPGGMHSVRLWQESCVDQPYSINIARKSNCAERNKVYSEGQSWALRILKISDQKIIIKSIVSAKPSLKEKLTEEQVAPLESFNKKS